MYFSLSENRYERENFFLVKINPSLISVLRQTRTQMSNEGIEDLCSSIKEGGQKTPGDIYAFNEYEANQYLRKINDLWNTNYSIFEFQKYHIPEKGQYFYLFLVAGHRRLKACIELGVDYLVNIHFEKNFEEAIKWQLAENLHEELPLLDLINSATNLWVLLKKHDEKLTLSYFAKNHIHKSVSWLSNALKFIRLPVKVQDLIKKTESRKGVSYSIMLEFAKLYDFSVSKGKPLNEDLLMALIAHCIAHKYSLSKVKEFCEIKREEIEGQQEFFMLLVEEIDHGTLSAIRSNRTKHMIEAQGYLQASSVIAKQITDNCKVKAENVILIAEQMRLILPSE